VVIDNLNVMSVPGSPAEADTPLLVDPDAMLSLSVPTKSLQAVARRDSQIIQRLGGIQNQGLSIGCPLHVRRQPSVALSRENPLSRLALEGSDHENIVTGGVSNVRRYVL
jgi:hypothetical protein